MNWTVIGTCRMNKKRVYEYVYDVMKAWFGKPNPPSLLPEKEPVTEAI